MIHTNASFNAAQQAAISWDEGPLLVIAGPGSGKTSVLTARIARLLRASAGKTFRILALTFTNMAAKEMQSRISELVPNENSRLFVGTFHSFCSDVLRQHGSHVSVRPSFQVLASSDDTDELLAEVYQSLINDGVSISVSPKDLLTLIQGMKRNLVAPSEAESYLNLNAAPQIALGYRRYEELLTKNNALDFDALIAKTVELFNRVPSISSRYRTVYKYVCIDEAQDTNPAQYRLLKSLTGLPADQKSITNVFAVADDDQLIYRFTGASETRLTEFCNDYGASVVQLPVNYRCPPQIVEIANKLIKHNFKRTEGKAPIVPAKERSDENVVRVLCAESFEDEALLVVNDIKNRFGELKVENVVVIARTRKLLSTFREIAASANLVTALADRKDDFVSTPMVFIEASLKFANNRNSLRYLGKLSACWHELFGTAISVERIMTAAKGNDRDYFSEFLSEISAPQDSDGANIIAGNLIGALSKGDYRAFIRDVLTWFCEASADGDADPLKESFADFDDERQVWEKLSSEITMMRGSDCPLAEFLQELQLRSKASDPPANAVELTTIHGVKGKQFSHVYLIGMVDDELPSFQSLKRGDNSADLEEERRNCFVAITRVRETLTMSYARTYRGWAKRPSRFLREMELLGA